MTTTEKIPKNIQQIIIDNPKTSYNIIWLNINNPGLKEIEFLRKKYNFNLMHLHASSAKSFSQRPMISEGSGYLFMILHFPYFCDDNIVAGEIEFFISKDYLITLHSNNIPALNDFFNFCKKDKGSLTTYDLESSTILLYEILDKLMSHCYSILDKISISIARVEKIIFEQEQKTAVQEMLLLRRNIINFRKIMQNHKNIIKKLLEMENDVIPDGKNKIFYKKLIEQTKRVWEMLENQKEMIEVLNSTNESLLNYKISNIMRTLTIMSSIVFPLTLLAAVFGMKTVDTPIVNHTYGFYIIIGIMISVCGLMLTFFKKKKWF
jgi:magnesium transporter